MRRSEDKEKGSGERHMVYTARAEAKSESKHIGQEKPLYQASYAVYTA